MRYLQQVPDYRIYNSIYNKSQATVRVLHSQMIISMFLDKNMINKLWKQRISILHKKTEIALNVSYDKMKQYIGVLLHLLFI